MIIYEVIPNKIFPILNRYFAEKYTSFHVNDIWDYEGNSKIYYSIALASKSILFPKNFTIPRKLKEVNNSFYKNFLKIAEQSEINFISSIGKKELIEKGKTKSDYSFTLLNHPVDYIYTMFHYFFSPKVLGTYRRCIETLTEKKISHKDKDCVFNNFFLGRDWHIVNFFHKNFDSLENFIDYFIYNKGEVESNLFNFPLKLIPSASCKLSKCYDKHNFYGILNNEENFIKSLLALNKNFKINDIDFSIDIDLFKKSSNILNIDKSLNYNYRRKDLEVLYKDDIIIFEEKLKLLNEYR